MIFDEISRKLNQEWYRKPLSRLELTLRVPRLIKYLIIIFFFYLLLPWFLFTKAILLITQNIFLSLIIGLFSVILSGMIFLRSWYLKRILPRHLKNLRKIKELQRASETFNRAKLIKAIDDSVEKSAWGITHLVCLALPSFGWEVVFKFLYPLVVRNKNVPYQDLLIGFKNKVVEADQYLWELAHENDQERKKIMLEKFLEEYGSRGEDFDLSYPTLREQPDAIEGLAELYLNVPSPNSTLKKIAQKREKSVRKVLGKLAIPRPVFLKLLKIVQNNVCLREDRRFYELLPDFYIRQMILRLGEKMKVKEKEIFKMSWKEIGNAAA